MSMVINTNISSLAAQRSLAESSRSMETAMERLSSGKRINSAADDAAGLAVAARMDGQIDGLNQAIRNTADGIAMVETIEAAMDEAQDILLRMRTLATQAATDTTSSTDRITINNELTQLNNELTRMSQSVRFGDQLVLDGSFTAKSLQTGAEAGETVSLSVSSIAAASLGGHQITSTNQGPKVDGTGITSQQAAGEYFTITGNSNTTTSVNANTESAKLTAAAINALTYSTGVTAEASNTVRLAFYDDGSSASQSYNIIVGSEVAGSTVDLATFTAGVDDVAGAVTEFNKNSATTGFTAENKTTYIELTAVDGRDLYITNEDTTTTETILLTSMNHAGTATQGTAATIDEAGGTAEFGVVSGTIKLRSANEFSVTGQTGAKFATATSGLDAVSTVDATTQQGASDAIGTIQGAIDTLSGNRATLGSTVNRLEHSVDRLRTAVENQEAAKSLILDADMASESANLARAQVLQQVATAMLAQANAQPQLALQLLQ